MKFPLHHHLPSSGTDSRWFIRVAAFIFLLITGLPVVNAASPNAIPTFESLGLYWTPPIPPAPTSAGCSVQYRRAGESAWKDGLTMWYDARDGQCRGSLVQLSSETTYEMQFGIPGLPSAAQLTATTWSEIFPIAQTVYLPNGTTTQTLAITQSGSPSGYVLYTFPPGGQSTIDVANAQLNNITISAAYVIVRGLTLRGARQHSINLLDGAHDVVIEENDISGWGELDSTRTGLLGFDPITNPWGWQLGKDWASGGAGIFANCASMPGKERIIIQRNRIHDPRYGSNTWNADGSNHPQGPQAVGFIDCAGNHVIRYNEIYSSGEQHYFNDGIGGASNFSAMGFPGADSDVYGNIVMHTWDDGIESEGGNRNVRIWGNYLDQTATGIASTVAHLGPFYVFRNVYNRSRILPQSQDDDAIRGPFAKSGDGSGFGGGRRYLFHNTLLQAPGSPNLLGAGQGIVNAGPSNPVTNTVSSNNILHIWKTWWPSVEEGTGASGNDFNYDLYNGQIRASNAESNGIAGTPAYVAGHGWANESGGFYSLDPGSAGYDTGVRLANFNDAYFGTGPDIGAHEAGSPGMRFGVKMGQFLGRDVGAPALAGQTSVITAGSAYDVVGAGNDIYGTSDQFQYAYNIQSGDFDLRARLSSLTQADPWSKAGLMARESLAAGSRMVSLHATPATGAGGYEFMYRAGTGEYVQKVDGSTQVSYPNTWVRLKRVGNDFTSYTSSDGVNWVPLGATTLSLPASIYLGMVVSSHNESQSVVANFRDLGTRSEQTVTGLNGAWVGRGAEVATFSGGSAVSSDAGGATAAFTFTGTGVSWIGLKCNVCGIANVSIDGGAPIPVDTTGVAAPGSSGLASESVFAASNLAPGAHTLVITVTGTATSGGAHIVVDAFDVTP